MPNQNQGAFDDVWEMTCHLPPIREVADSPFRARTAMR